VLLIFGFLTSAITNRFPQPELAEHPRETIIKALVLQVTSQEENLYGELPAIKQTLQLEILTGPTQGTIVNDVVSQADVYSTVPSNKGDKLLIGYLHDDTGEYYFVIDHVRFDAILWLSLLLLILLVLVIKSHTLPVILSMAISFYLVFQFIVPFITHGFNPVIVSLAGLALIIPSSFYLVHGYRHKTTMAVAGTLITLCFTTILAWFVIDATKLTGIVTEDVFTVFATQAGSLSLQGLLLSGILLSVLGILDDVTITQASIVHELKKSAPLSKPQLFRQAMQVGRDHIASVVNTLILVYAGTALPTLILLFKFPRPLMVTLNHESLVLEIVFALLGTIALVIAIPITTALSVYTTKIPPQPNTKNQYRILKRASRLENPATLPGTYQR
jgi:uncharacterized membrane protein